MPANSIGTTVSSRRQTIHRTGRTNRSGLWGRQYILLGQEIEEISLLSICVRTCNALRPGSETVAATYSPLAVVIFLNASRLTPAFFAKACAAGVGWSPSRKA